MLVVGERINSTRKRVQPAIENKDVAAITEEATMQTKAGAHYLDCNAATVGVDREPEYLTWLVQTVQSVTDGTPCAIDSPNSKAVQAALNVHKGVPMINSISAEKAKFDALLPLARDAKAKVVALVMDDEGIPKTAKGRITIGRRLVDGMVKAGIEPDNIYLDSLVYPVGAEANAGTAVLETIQTLRKSYPGIHFICGLSNVSYGLPNRKLLNQAFMVLTMGAGLDAVIVDPTDKKLMSLVYAAEALLGRDEFCANYIQASRAELLE
jgi:5-methyltetrahydrofolate--homocysteine methyltransferase